MKILGFNISKDNAPSIEQEKGGATIGRYPVISEEYDGEKTDGDLGSPVEYHLDYDAMAARAWQHFIDTDLVSIVLERYMEWVIGKGLYLQSSPDMRVITSEGVKVTRPQITEFAQIAESRFRLLANSKLSDHRGLDNLHKMSIEILKTCFLSGDCLAIYRVTENGLVSVDYIDGQNIETPFGVDLKEGTRIIQGIELNDKGEHVAFWVKKAVFEYERIEAKDSFGRIRAELVYWKKAKRSDVRGLSGLHGVFQKMRNIDRFTEATVQGAVSRANLAYFITSDKDAMSAGPLLGRMPGTAKVTDNSDVNFDQTKRRIFAETAKTVHELPPGYKIEIPETGARGDNSAKEFVSMYFNYFCAAIGIPPEVALQLYTNSFSASRMATKSWEHTLKVKRAHGTVYNSVYRLFIDVQISAGKIEMPTLRKAIYEKNEFLILAFCNNKLIGANVPHADPVKEAKAHRELLGNKEIPLESANTATESLGTGDYDEILEQRKIEIEQEKELDLSLNKTEVYE